MSNHSTVFIYTPRTGDRVVACRPINGVVVIEWTNRCRHVVGGVELSYDAAEPKRWWRNVACTMAEAIVQATGGIAWDDRGTINLIVPDGLAFEADQRMRSARPPRPARDEDSRNEARQVVAGAAKICVLYHPEALRLGVYPQAAAKSPPWTGYYWEAGEGVTLVSQEGEHQVRAPWEVASCSVPRLPSRQSLSGITVEDAVLAGYCRQGVLDWVATYFPGRDRLTVEELEACSALDAEQKQRILAAAVSQLRKK